MAKPDAIVIAGANGAGKTTLTNRLVRHVYSDIEFLNADEIQSEGEAFAHPMAAGRELVHRWRAAEQGGRGFMRCGESRGAFPTEAMVCRSQM